MATHLSAFNISTIDENNLVSDIQDLIDYGATRFSYENEADIQKLYEAEITWHDSPTMQENLEICCTELKEMFDYPDCEKDIAAFKEATTQSFIKATHVLNDMAEKQTERAGANDYYTRAFDLFDHLMDLNMSEYYKEEIVIPQVSKENVDIALNAFKFCSPENESLQRLKELIAEKGVTYKEFRELYVDIKAEEANDRKPNVYEYENSLDELRDIYSEIDKERDFFNTNELYREEGDENRIKEAEIKLSVLVKEYDEAMDKTIEAARNIHNEWNANYLHGFKYSREAFELEFTWKNKHPNHAFAIPQNKELEEALNRIENPNNVLLNSKILDYVTQPALDEYMIATDYYGPWADETAAIGGMMQRRMDYDKDSICDAIERAPMMKIAHQLEDIAREGDWERFKNEFNAHSEEEKDHIYTSIFLANNRRWDYVARLSETASEDLGYGSNLKEIQNYFKDYPETEIKKEMMGYLKECTILDAAKKICSIEVNHNLEKDDPFIERTKQEIASDIEWLQEHGGSHEQAQQLEDMTPVKLIVHGGVFHADDVMCAAMAKMLNPDVEIVRTVQLDPKDVEMNGTNGIYIADVGGGKYDHHQQDAAVRDDGNKYAACGLLYNEWKDKLFPNNPEAQKYFEEVFIKPIEQADNGIAPNSLTTAIGEAVLTWRESGKNMDEAFNHMVDFCEELIDGAREKTLEHEDLQHIHDKNDKHEEMATKCVPWATELGKYTQAMIDESSELRKTLADKAYQWDTEINKCAISMVEESGEKGDLLSKALNLIEASETHRDEILWAKDFTLRTVENFTAIEAAKDQVMEAYNKADNKEVVNLPRYMPWTETLATPELEAKFVVYPSIRGGVNLQCVPPEPESFDKKVPIPSEWLAEKPEGCSFVHPACFLASFDTAEHAVEAAESILRQELEKTTEKDISVEDFSIEDFCKNELNAEKLESLTLEDAVQKIDEQVKNLSPELQKEAYKQIENKLNNLAIDDYETEVLAEKLKTYTKLAQSETCIEWADKMQDAIRSCTFDFTDEEYQTLAGDKFKDAIELSDSKTYFFYYQEQVHAIETKLDDMRTDAFRIDKDIHPVTDSYSKENREDWDQEPITLKDINLEKFKDLSGMDAIAYSVHELRNEYEGRLLSETVQDITKHAVEVGNDLVDDVKAISANILNDKGIITENDMGETVVDMNTGSQLLQSDTRIAECLVPQLTELTQTICYLDTMNALLQQEKPIEVDKVKDFVVEDVARFDFSNPYISMAMPRLDTEAIVSAVMDHIPSELVAEHSEHDQNSINFDIDHEEDEIDMERQFGDEFGD